MKDCFENIIGFTESDCPCFNGQDLEDYKTSHSGLYMDSLEETKHILKAVKGTSDCGQTMGKAFESARRNAIIQFKERLMIELGTRFTPRQNPYHGLIGQLAITAPLALASNYVGATYEMLPFKGGVLRVDKLYVAINETRQVNVEVYKAYVVGGMYNIQGPALATVSVDAIQNQAVGKVLETPLFLPLTDESTHVVHYLFLMDRSAGFQPMDVKTLCATCSSSPQIDRWLVQGSIEGNDKENLQLASRKTGKNAYLNGIVAEGSISCSDTGFICEAYHSSPFLKVAIEHAILYQAASNLLGGVLRTDAINRFSLTKREEMKTDSVILHNKFKSRVVWISENMDMKPNNCFVCNTINEVNAPYKTMIKF